jgi:Flp pilus assembly protein TadG
MTLWLLGLSLVLLTLGGLGVDLWRGFAERRALVDIADAAAFAAASGIDEERFRATGEVRLDPSRARALAGRSIASQPDADALTTSTVAVAADGGAVVVTVRGEVPLTLLRLVTTDALEVEVTAVAHPVVRP